MNFFIRPIFILFCFASAFPAAATISSQGKEFWLAFPESGPQYLYLTISSDVATTGTIQIPGVGFTTAFSVAAGSSVPVTIPNSADVTTQDGIAPNGIHVTAADPVRVYAMSYGGGSSDGYMGLPVEALGTDYISLSSGNAYGSEFAVVGTQNCTFVTITPSASTGTRLAGIPYSMILNQGDVYQLMSLNFGGPALDLSGTLVTSDKPVAFFPANDADYMPTSAYIYADHMVEQMWPIQWWGMDFLTLPFAGRTGGDTFRYLASVDGTVVKVNGVPVAALNRGQFLQQGLSAASEITSNNPIYVMHYANSQSFDNVLNGDPTMISVPPINEYASVYTTSNMSSLLGDDYENLVVPNSAVNSMSLDGAAIPAASFAPIGSSGYSGAQLKVSIASHQLAGPLPFGLSVYGFSHDDAYGYPGGVFFSLNTPVPTSTPPTGPCSVPTITPTPMDTWTPTDTFSPTLTPTFTPTFTITPTPTFTVTKTPTLTPTITLSPTFTQTPTPTITPTQTPSPTPACLIHIWPDPFAPGFAFNHTLKFGCLPLGSQILIFTVSGEQVRTIDRSGDPTEWDGKNSGGILVAPGIYFCVVRRGSDVLFRDKFLLTQ